MNLRADKNSIRIRVSEDESHDLVRAGMLKEYFPLLNASIIIKLTQSIGKDLIVNFLPNHDFEINIPTHFFEFTGSNVELSSMINLYGSSVELLFEIDRFTRKKIK